MPDYERIRREVPMHRLCSTIGITVRSGFAICPFHRDGNASMRIYPEDGGFYCFGCHAGGDVIDFYARLSGKSKREAAEVLACTYCISDPKRKTAAQRQAIAQEKAASALRRRFAVEARNSLAKAYRGLRSDLGRFAPKRENVDAPWPAPFADACNLIPALEEALDCFDRM